MPWQHAICPGSTVVPKTPAQTQAAGYRLSQTRLALSILLDADILDESPHFCYDVPRPSASHTDSGYLQYYFLY